MASPSGSGFDRKLREPFDIGRSQPLGSVEQRFLAVRLMGAQDRRPRAEQIARTFADLGQQRVGIAFRRQLEIQARQRRQPLVRGLELAGLGHQLVGDQAQMRTVEFVRVRHAGDDFVGAEGVRDGVENFPRLARFGQHQRDTA